MSRAARAEAAVPDELLARQRAFAALINAADDPDAQAPAAAALLQRLGGAAPRLGVYRDAYRARLIEALSANYPVLHRVLGDDAFAALAQAYLAAHPSRNPSIRWFGDRLPAWLRARLADDARALPHPALADLADMEWALGLSFDAADAAPVAHAALAALAPAAWPELRFAPHASVTLLQMGWSVEPVWRTLTDHPEAATDPPEARPHALLVWRLGLESRFRSLPAAEASALQACLSGRPFAGICAQVAAAPPAGAGAWPADSAAQRVAGWLAQWVADGLLLRAPDDEAPAE